MTAAPVAQALELAPLALEDPLRAGGERLGAEQDADEVGREEEERGDIRLPQKPRLTSPVSVDSYQRASNTHTATPGTRAMRTFRSNVPSAKPTSTGTAIATTTSAYASIVTILHGGRPLDTCPLTEPDTWPFARRPIGALLSFTWVMRWR